MIQYIFGLVVTLAVYQLCSGQANVPDIPREEFDCRTAQPPAVNCETDPNCLYPDPSNCSRFYQCQSQDLLATRKECAWSNPPLVFNNNSKQCDWTGCTPENAPPEDEEPVETTTLEEEEETTTTEAPVEETTTASTPGAPQPEPTTTTEAPEPPQDTTTEGSSTASSPAEAPPNTQPSTTPEECAPVGRVCDSPQAQTELSKNPPCPAPRNCMFTNPDNCQTYIQCQPGGSAENGVPIQYEMQCAIGHNGQLYWNDNTLTCEERSNSTCSSRKSSNCEPPEGAPEPTSTASEPEDTTTQGSSSAAPSSSTTTEAPAEDTTTASTPEAPQPEPTTTEAPEETTTEGSSTASSPAEAPPNTQPSTTPEECAPVGRVCDSPQAQAELSKNPPCPAPRNCMFTNPDNCQTFIQCQPGGSAENGVPIQYEMPCANGHNGQLYWNDNTLTCEERSNSTCSSRKSSNCEPPEGAPEPTTTESEEDYTTTQGSSSAAPPEPTTTEESGEETTTGNGDEDAPTGPPTTDTTTTREDTTTEATSPPTSTTTIAPTTTTEATTPPTTAPSTVAPTEEAPPVGRVCDSPQAQAELSKNPPCPAPRHCMFTNPDNCQTFIQCQPGGPAENYVPIQYTMPCANGHNGQLYWNDNTLTCEERSNSTCPNAKLAYDLYRLPAARMRRSVLFAKK